VAIGKGSDVDELQLIEQAKTDKEAFGQLYERYNKQISSYIYYRVGNSHDAEDLTTRVFMRAMQHIPHYEDQGVPFSAWLYRIARNLVANWHRDQNRRQMLSLEDMNQWHFREESPELALEWAEHKETLYNAIRRLPRDRQELLILKFVDRLSNAEIGEILDRSEGAIKSLYHRTLLALREEISQEVKDAQPVTQERTGLFRLPWRR
jgi:RNA polymerase sigma-70 factor (ECF subfamily)